MSSSSSSLKPTSLGRSSSGQSPSRRALFLAALALVMVAAAGLIAGRVWTSSNSRSADVTVDARTLVQSTLQTVYAAYSEEAEEATYDALADVAHGAALETLYLDRRKALANTGLDSAVQTIHEIDLRELISRTDDTSLSSSAKWFVLGLVGHGEHQHVRGNGYRADLTFQLLPTSEGSRLSLSEFTLLSVERDVEAGQ